MNVDKLSSKIGTRQEWLRILLAEFLGTLLLVFMGNNSVAQMVLNVDRQGSFLSVNFAYGLAVTLGILVAGGGSGAHLNPAVTLALAVVGKCRWKHLPVYMLGQYLGAFCSAPLTYIVYSDAIYNYDSGVRMVVGTSGTAGIFTTYPKDYLTLWGALLDQVLGTMVLLLGVCAITDKRNMDLHKSTIAIHVGLLVVLIGMALGMNCGYAINPARDLGPRIFVTIAGWGLEAFTYDNYWWVPIAGPHVGGLIGALVYVFMIEIHLASAGDEGAEDKA